ncbi:hypothetical protein [Mycobacterium simiae]|uniref:hypothetical protein n=1 Tax=Mycobacterium simiae TaxID=1784 RepID=UPI0011F3451B|nr:hypothetical protein [Mycobacterium simiae]
MGPRVLDPIAATGNPREDHVGPITVGRAGLPLRYYGAGGAGGKDGADDGDSSVVSVGGGVVGVVTVAVTVLVPSVAVIVAGSCLKVVSALEVPVIP